MRNNGMKKKVVLWLAVFLFAVSAAASAGTLKISWNPSPEADHAGYWMYYTEEGGTEVRVDVGNVTAYELKGLITGTYYTIEMTAYDTTGNESDKSYGVRDRARYSKVTGLKVIK